MENNNNDYQFNINKFISGSGHPPHVLPAVDNAETPQPTVPYANSSTTSQWPANPGVTSPGIASPVVQPEITYIRTRRKLISQYVYVNNNYNTILVTQFDNGECEINPFIINCFGPIVIHRAEVVDYKINNKCAVVQFGPKTFPLDCEKLRHDSWLYHKLREEGVIFNQSLSDKVIKKSLKEFILYSLGASSTTKPIRLSALAGWNDWLFQSVDNIPYIALIKEVLPCSKKSFQQYIPDEHGFKQYFQEINKLSSEIDRAILLTYPFLGLLHSIFIKYGISQRFYLNTIPLGNLDCEKVASWFQIFNRNSPSVISANINPTEFNKVLTSSKDEVLIFDSRSYEGEAQYSKSKKRETSGRIAEIVNRGAVSNNGDALYSSVVMVSDEFRNGNVINMVVDDVNESITGNTIPWFCNQCMEKILYGVVSHVMNHPDQIEQYLRKKRNESDKRLVMFDIVFDILEDFFKAEGYDLREEINLPTTKELAGIFDDNGDFDEDRRNTFIAIVRKEAVDWLAYPKHNNMELPKGSFSYDTTRLYFPCALLRNVFHYHHRDSLLIRVLPYLREQEELITDAPNLTVKKIQCNNIRRNFYVFTRRFFNQVGLADIVDIARRPEDD